MFILLTNGEVHETKHIHYNRELLCMQYIAEHDNDIRKIYFDSIVSITSVYPG